MIDAALNQHRLLCLFVPTAEDDAFAAQWTLLYRELDALAAANVRIVSVFDDDVGDLDGHALPETDSDALRRRARLRPGSAAAVLFDVGGTELRRWPLPVAVASVLNAL